MTSIAFGKPIDSTLTDLEREAGFRRGVRGGPVAGDHDSAGIDEAPRPEEGPTPR